ncbi:rRNA maturation RNase YbeY [Flavobacteriaceae bacterium]|jgi:rRNA maturation RNase YbeY|nr:rRNA maturation RNase YbeY [Flavobacteriaceae bacterium]
MINFNNTTLFNLPSEAQLKTWLQSIIEQEGYNEGELNFLFCDDDHLHKLNVEFLNHDTLTDIITFDYNVGRQIYSDICISIDRVQDNALIHKVSSINELSRVMAHGVLHLCGYKDSTIEEKEEMRSKEDLYLSQLNLNI